MTAPLRVIALFAENQADVFAQLGQTRTWVGFDGGDLPFPVLLSVAKADDGRLICTGLIAAPTYTPKSGEPDWWSSLPADRSEVTSRSLRQIPVADLLAALHQHADPRTPGDALAGLVHQLAGDAADVPRTRPGPRGYDRAHFVRVAAAYRHAVASRPDAPWAAFVERLQVSESTARRWVQRARDMDLLGQSQPGKAGEATTREEPDA